MAKSRAIRRNFHREIEGLICNRSLNTGFFVIPELVCDLHTYQVIARGSLIHANGAGKMNAPDLPVRVIRFLLTALTHSDRITAIGLF